VPRVDPDHTTTVGLDRDQARALMVAADTGTSFVVVLAPYQAGWLAAARGLHGEIADKGDKAPIPGRPTTGTSNGPTPGTPLNRLQRCYERREAFVTAFFDLADTIITVRSLIRQAWTTHRWDNRPRDAHDHLPIARPLGSTPGGLRRPTQTI
jgi:hypothetical protein